MLNSFCVLFVKINGLCQNIANSNVILTPAQWLELDVQNAPLRQRWRQVWGQNHVGTSSQAVYILHVFSKHDQKAITTAILGRSWPKFDSCQSKTF